MKIIQTANGIQLVDDEVEKNSIDLEYTYINDEISQHLIEECEILFQKTGKTHFIFDYENKGKISSLTHKTKEEKRGENLDIILNDEKFYISDGEEFRIMPSMFSYYDTEKKSQDRYKRYKIVTDFIKEIGFQPSEWNLGPEYEQSFSIELIDSGFNKWTLRLRPNLFLSIEHLCKNISEGHNVIIYNKFFNRNNILECLLNSNKEFFEAKVRDIKLSNVLN